MSKDKTFQPEDFSEAVRFASKHGFTQEALLQYMESIVQSCHSPALLYDSVIRTEIDKLGRLILLLVNHIFGTSYTGDEQVEYGQTEMSGRLPDGTPRTVRADSHFRVTAADGSCRTFHIECQTADDGSILLRIAEYDLLFALRDVVWADEECTLNLPESAIIYLWSPAKKRSGGMTWHLANGDGQVLDYHIRTLSVESSSVDEMFREKLYALLPFYLFTHGDRLAELIGSDVGREALVEEAVNLAERVLSAEALTNEEKWRLLELAVQVMKKLIPDGNLRKEMEMALYAAPLELKTDRIFADMRKKAEEEALRRAREQVQDESRKEGSLLMLYRLVSKGRLTMAEAAEEAGESVEAFRQEMENAASQEKVN